jgi:hypothetical protein
MEESSTSLPSSNVEITPAKEQLPFDQRADGEAESGGLKRKWEGHKNKKQQQGSKRHKGRDMGRQEYLYVRFIFQLAVYMNGIAAG